MFTQTWKKYLPVIKLFLKRSVKQEQVLEMNSSDFQKAAGGKKIKYSFVFTIAKARIEQANDLSPVARQLAEVLLQDDLGNAFLQKQVIEFTMKSNFQLGIKNLTPAAVPVFLEEQVETTGTPEETQTGEPELANLPEEEVKTADNGIK